MRIFFLIRRMGMLFAAMVLFVVTVRIVAQPHHSVFISELMADPTPSVGLPLYEWIEIRNGTRLPIQLQNWRVGTATALSGPFPFYWLAPDSLLILCAASALPSLATIGKALAISNFPALDNDGTVVWLRDPSGRSVHALSYDKSLYGSSFKSEGGWSLEMIDWRWPCSDASNWKASRHIRGGSPGAINSVQDLQTDLVLPAVIHSYASATDQICIQFSAPIDSSWSVRPSLFGISNGANVINAKTLDLSHTVLECKLNRPLLTDSVYILSLAGIKSCHADEVGKAVSLKTGVASSCQPRDVVINEILFNPRSGGSDFAEFYNNSKRIIDLSSLYITNRQSGGGLGSFIRLSQGPRLLFPGDHVAFSSEPHAVMKQYLVSSSDHFFQTSGFPSLPDEEGQLVLIDHQGDVIDELHYQDDWHFPLLQDKEGVSLERIDPKGPSQLPANWHSAAKTAVFNKSAIVFSQPRRTRRLLCDQLRSGAAWHDGCSTNTGPRRSTGSCTGRSIPARKKRTMELEWKR
ncbi:MAG: lamin tail domain-containing protein [Chitinophagales bacterium]|nr:lamin tail domain-containing protein [Chitinophagales bacterium]